MPVSRYPLSLGNPCQTTAQGSPSQRHRLRRSARLLDPCQTLVAVLLRCSSALRFGWLRNPYSGLAAARRIPAQPRGQRSHRPTERWQPQPNFFFIILQKFRRRAPSSAFVIWPPPIIACHFSATVCDVQNPAEPTRTDVGITSCDVEPIPWEYAPMISPFQAAVVSIGKPALSNEYAACLDFSVANHGFLTAYRWSGEKVLSPNNIVYAAASSDLLERS
jgi:hypothetical protein